MKHLSQLGVILTAVCLPLTAAAHQPRMVTGNSVTVQKPQISQAFYAELHGRPQIYRIGAHQPFTLYLQLTVPEIAGARTDFSLQVSRDGQIFQRLDGTRATWRTFHEPFGGDTYLEGPEYEKTAAPAGNYRIKITSPDNRGKYVLAVGKTESFTLADWLRTLAVLPKVKTFMGKSPLTAYFNLTGLAVLVPLLLILVLIYVVRRSLHRRRQVPAV